MRLSSRRIRSDLDKTFKITCDMYGITRVFSSFHELMQCRTSSVIRLSVCKHFTQTASSTRQMTGSRPNLHTMVPRWACIQDVLKIKVEVKGHVIWTLLWFHENCFFSQADGWITTKLAHDGPQKSLHPGCAQSQGRGERSCDLGTFVMSRNVCYTVQSHLLSLHVLTSWSTISLSFQYKYNSARSNV